MIMYLTSARVMEEIWPDEKRKKEFIPRTPVTRIIQCAPVYSENEVGVPPQSTQRMR
jgi:hypothetical protein